MRGWILLHLDADADSQHLLFLLEELQTGIHPYTVAAAARSLRQLSRKSPALADYLLQALKNIRYNDEPLDLESYGQYSENPQDSGAVWEILESLKWLGEFARHRRETLDSLRPTASGLPEENRAQVEQILTRLDRTADASSEHLADCCQLPEGVSKMLGSLSGWRRRKIHQCVLEDHRGTRHSFQGLFVGRPSIVVFFYTRCDNPLKCSLTIAKLATMQTLLREAGQEDQIQTVAITYDPDYDHGDRLREFVERRGVELNDHHHVVRVTRGFESLKRHFQLRVNFIGSLVNHHRIELFLLDQNGHPTTCFERIHWQEEAVVAAAANLLDTTSKEAEPTVRSRTPVTGVLGTLASIGVLLAPKCPLCWAAYLSAFGIAGVDTIPYSPLLVPGLVMLICLNLVCLWLRAISIKRWVGFWIALVGAGLVAVAYIGQPLWAAWAGVILLGLGSLCSAVLKPKNRVRGIS